MSCLNYCNPACDPEFGGYPDSDCFKRCGRHEALTVKDNTTTSNQTASQKAKQLGCKSLRQITDKTGTSLQTLTNWHHNKPDLFYVVCVGVAALQSADA
jgi:hypothetical protein